MDQVGKGVVDVILNIATLLTKSENAPGNVALVLFVSMVLIALLFIVRMARRARTIASFRRIITSYEDKYAFTENFEEVKQRADALKNKGKHGKALWDSWDEYRETIFLDDANKDQAPLLRNSIRPSSFLNSEDLGFAAGGYRVWPNVFVSIGLLFTFLGLVAALRQFSDQFGSAGGTSGMEQAMVGFMQIASAKFIMSLAGLLCSILLTLLIRFQSNWIEGHIHSLCLAIERRLVFVSLEELSMRQLKAADEQKAGFQEIANGMVERLQQPLEALPDRITETISKEINPIFDKVSKMGSSNMEGLVGNLSDQLSHSVGNALTRASDTLGEAADRMHSMIDKMGASNAQAGEGLQKALTQMSNSLSELKSHVSQTGEVASNAMTEGAEKLLSVMNDTLSGIRDNTAEGSKAMSATAEELRKSAEGFRDQLAKATEDGVTAAQARMAETSAKAGEAIEGAGQAIQDSFAKTGADIARLGSELGETVGKDILGHLATLGEQIKAAATSIERGAGSARTAASGFESSASAINIASSRLEEAGSALSEAAGPIRATQESIDSNIRRLEGTVQETGSTIVHATKEIAENARMVLETAQTALGTEREGIRQSLEATRAALTELSDQAEKLDDIDELLGKALTQYSSQLEAALGLAQDHIDDMNKKLEPGLQTLRGVVEQAEAFIPSQSRRS